MHHALWDRRHEGPRVHWRIRMAPECLRSHNAWYIKLKSDYGMNYLALIYFEAEICKRSSEASGESCIEENLCMILQVTCVATALWRHNDPGVTKSGKCYAILKSTPTHPPSQTHFSRLTLKSAFTTLMLTSRCESRSHISILQQNNISLNCKK